MKNTQDYFINKSNTYENDSKIVDNVKNIADAILKEFSYHKNMQIMDFGSGTGFLTSHLASHVKKITAVDISRSMNEVLETKIDDLPCEIEILELDLSTEIIDKNFDAIISSMTVHHIEDTLELFKKFHSLLETDGTIAIADLETEDGSFHKDDTGVFHFGFDKDLFLQIAEQAGFSNLKIETVSVAIKPYGEYPIFLLTGKK
jgi:cyclopropane fatty-acyl-phospholipid synthase-like methyltransferase